MKMTKKEMIICLRDLQILNHTQRSPEKECEKLTRKRLAELLDYHWDILQQGNEEKSFCETFETIEDYIDY